MAWYKTGTIAVTNGSTTVTGTSTDFINGARAGDGFVGPDDKLYEIASITSTTVLVLSEAYGGSTASGQSYSIVTMQSRVKDLADSATTLVNNFSNAGAGKFPDGTAGAPAVSFVLDADTGFYRIGANNIGVAVGGSKVLDLSSTNASFTGNVGIGTTSPTFKLDVAGNARASYFALRSNETAPSESSFIYRPDTGVLGFGTSTEERMRIDSSGNLLVGTTSANSTGGGFSFRTGNVHYMNIAHASSVGHGNYFAAFKHNDTVVGTITKTNTTGVSYNTSSDERLKENITDSADAGSKVDAIQIRQYDWKADGSHQDYGVIAQELVEVAPEAVHQPIDPDDMMGVDHSKLVPMLVKEIQSLRSRVAELEKN